MKILILSGTHPRHLFVHQQVLAGATACAAIVMQRESTMPEPPGGLPARDRENFVLHFRERNDCETRGFGELRPETVFADCATHFCSPATLNSPATAQFAKAFGADIAFIFGTDLVKDPLLSALPADRINLHLGLSPWYRGSATLFWPFYFLQPQLAGVTFHQIVPAADAGAILHQSVPELRLGDGIHDVAVRAVTKAGGELRNLLAARRRDGGWRYHGQKTPGRLFRASDFEPAHLRVIYDLFEGRMVDEYLEGRLGRRAPELVTCRFE